MDIKKIIECIDEHLTKNNLASIGPVEAAELLERNNLLSDSKDRPGKPLRDLLRKGKLPHAYQVGGKGSSWVIPLSNTPNTVGSNYAQSSKRTAAKTEKSKEKIKPENIKEILKNIEEARLKYKPNLVKYLLVAEAPPESVDRFFYFENVKQHDYLFLGVAQALYPNLKDRYLAEGRNTETKKEILEKMKSEGFYLIDLSDLPLSLIEGDLKDQLPNLNKKIEAVAKDATKIILIKANVYDLAYQYLVSEGVKNIIDQRITFPGQGGQIKFQVEFAKALKEAGY